MSGFRRAAGVALRAVVLWVLVALIFLIVTALLPGVEIPSFGAAMATTLVIALINGLLWPLIIRIVLPLTVFTFGLGSLVLNAAVVIAAIDVVDGEAPSFLEAVIIAFVLSVALMLLTPALSFDDDARQLRLVRRRARKVREANRTDVPGVIMFEIDGLAEPVLERALREGHVPTMKRWIDEGSHQVIPWECDLSSQTGASQAGLLLGSNFDMPAFRWYEKESGKTLVSNHGKDAVELERRHSDGGGLLAAGGTSRGNLFSGDAPRCSATMSVIRDRQRSSASEYIAYFADPYGFTRTIAKYLWDVMLEIRAARRQRRLGEEHVDRGGLYPWMRGAITVIMRDLNTATLMGDIVEGVPVSYSTFVGYDEVAHHSGIEQPDAFAVLKQHDAQLARLERAVELAPRPVPPRRPLRPRPDPGPPLPPALRQGARRARPGVAADGQRLCAGGRRRGSDERRQRPHRRPRRGQRRRPDRRPRDQRQPRRRRGGAGAEPQGGRAGRRGRLRARGDRARLGRPRPRLPDRERRADDDR